MRLLMGSGSAAMMLILSGCRTADPLVFVRQGQAAAAQSTPSADPLAPISGAAAPAAKIVNRAKQEARSGVVYDAGYRRITYPGGDVAADRGACTDVIVRALRCAGLDLQQKIHEDAGRHPGRYPRLERPGGDASIDHRRAANHIAYFRRYGKALPTTTVGAAAKSWQPGDLVYWKLGNNLDHCGVVSNVRNAQGLPLVIHNIGIARQEDCLTAWKIVAHFRYPKG